ncbi:PrsW family intramembrane metalloprotease [Asanoa siamensis]|uniref:Protease PrsW n=1 Tax=Asanoa siamensis TaxID=926357 RepID=A0ABQ4CZV9_9ACTN|nr:PrsW family intramembrane metalloprotease [Asanoa siamensis]GIF76824.1 protease PrsW [Asanoa siamensis]
MTQPMIATPAEERRGWRVLVLLGVILFIALCAITMSIVLGWNIGVQATVIGLAAAILPVPVLVACFLWLDRYEPEPAKLLAVAFTWGAFVATLAAYGVNSFAADRFAQWGLPESLVAVLVAPFIEETMKALGPALILVLYRREFSGITDGIVYCGLSAVGFAMVENILYLGGHGYAAGREEVGPAFGAQMLILTFIVRIFLTGFAHPLFTSMTGIGLGIAARSADRWVRVCAPLAGLLVAMMLHGTWNLLPTLALATGQELILLYGYIALMVPVFFGVLGLTIWLRGFEGRLTERALPIYVQAGWLSPPEVAALGSLARRHAARQWARRVAGPDGVKAMRGFQFAATRLALLRDGLERGLDSRPVDRGRAERDEQRLLAEISTYRQAFVGRDPQVPPALWDGERYEVMFPDGVRRPLPAPEDPVVPIPVVLAPPRPYYGGPGYR